MSFLLSISNQKLFVFIIREIDTTLAHDDCIMNIFRGFFARVLIDVDMLTKLPNYTLVERPGFAFIMDMEYENLSPFCSFCSFCRMIVFWLIAEGKKITFKFLLFKLKKEFLSSKQKERF